MIAGHIASWASAVVEARQIFGLPLATPTSNSGDGPQLPEFLPMSPLRSFPIPFLFEILILVSFSLVVRRLSLLIKANPTIAIEELCVILADSRPLAEMISELSFRFPLNWEELFPIEKTQVLLESGELSIETIADPKLIAAIFLSWIRDTRDDVVDEETFVALSDCLPIYSEYDQERSVQCIVVQLQAQYRAVLRYVVDMINKLATQEDLTRRQQVHSVIFHQMIFKMITSSFRIRFWM